MNFPINLKKRLPYQSDYSQIFYQNEKEFLEDILKIKMENKQQLQQLLKMKKELQFIKNAIIGLAIITTIVIVAICI